MRADLVLVNGNVVSLDPSAPSAQAVATKNGKIVAVGTDSKIKKWIGKKTRIMNLRRKTVVPGLNDAHAHIIWLGHQSSDMDLRVASSIESIKRQLKRKAEATEKGKWILGRGWDQDRLREKRYPTRWDLDEAAPDNPAFIIRVCGHVGVANSEALRIAGIGKKGAESLGELVDVDPETGEPTGLVKEKAVDLIGATLEPSEKDLLKACRDALSEVAKVGLTSVTCIVNMPGEVFALQKLAKQGQLPLRVYVMIPVECLGEFKDKPIDDAFLKVKCVKIFADGSLGARTAALKEPYADEPSATGILYYSLMQLSRLVEEADEAGFQIAVHVIGDKAVEQALRAFRKAVGKGRIMRHRHRLEHASVLNSDLIKQIKALGLLATIQPHFVISDFWVVDRLGPRRARWTYAFRSLVENGIRVAASSDAPVENLNPLLGVWAAVTRKRFPEEQLSVIEALKAYTLGAAYSSFEEDDKGSIEVGKFADLTVLSQNPLKVKPNMIKNIKVEMTIVGGNIVYSASD